MNQGKHANLGLGILIGGLAAALFFRQAPEENDALPELEQTNVLERDFSLDFEEEPVLANEIDQFETLHPLEFGDSEISPSGAQIRGIEIATTPERDRPIPESDRDNRFHATEKKAAIAESTSRSDDVRKNSNPETNVSTAGTSLSAQTVKAKVTETPGFVLPDNLFTESFLQDNIKTSESSVDQKSTHEPRPNGGLLPKVESINPSETQLTKQPSANSAHPVEQPVNAPARVIIPRRIRLGEPFASQLGMGTNSLRENTLPRSIQADSASADISSNEIRQRFTSGERLLERARSGRSLEREQFPSLDGLEPLPSSSTKN